MRKYHSHATPYRDESRAFYFALSMLIVVFSAYVYFTSASIVHVVMRKEVDMQIVALGTTVSTLEADYIEMQHSVSSDIASLNGFVVADEKIFIDKTDGTLVLSGN